MISASPPTSQFITGMTIILMLLLPVLTVYWIRQMLSHKTTVIRKVEVYTVYKLKTKSRRFCEEHKKLLLKKGVCLIVEDKSCDYCIKSKKGSS